MQTFTHPVTGHSIKLGKRPARKGLKKLKISDYINFNKLPTPPMLVDNTNGIVAWGDMLNAGPGAVGDCAVAAPAHMIQAWSAANGQEITISDALILAAYEAISGYNPDDSNTDVGCDMIDVLNYLVNVGIGGYKIDAWFPIDPTNTDEVIVGGWLCGGTYTGMALPITAQAQVGQLWSVENSADPNAAPGSWGGHATTLQKVTGPVINNPSNTCVTWGALQSYTPFWRLRYVDEEYCLVCPLWFGVSGRCPNGFDLKQITADAKVLSGVNSKLAKAS